MADATVANNLSQTGPARVIRNADLLAAILVVLVIAMLVVPLPTWLLDVLFLGNLTFAAMLVLAGLYVTQALQLSSFPSILLFATLFRLALNVAATKMILSQANAGRVVEVFGGFVVGNNTIVGLVVFAILIVIQFIVVTNGAGRVAEVAARFTLDAMPGKQMAIDADLNAGLIDEEQARERRKQIESEADFYGAMDGASKFVRGDAIAAIVIILINILGGFIIGVAQMGMTAQQAYQRYTLLTVGEGLVTQIPALMVAVATGILVTRSDSARGLGDDILTQLTRNPKPLLLASGVLLAFFLIPGLPKVPVLLMSALSFIVALNLQRGADAAARAALAAPPPKEEAPKGPENVLPLLTIDPLELGIGYALVPLVDAAQGGDLLARVQSIRRQMAQELGFVMPPVRIRDNLQLKPSQYEIKLRGNRIATGEVMVGQLMAMDSGAAQEPIDGIPAKEPAFGLPALWIARALRERAEMLGYTVVEPSAVIATHLSEVIKGNASELLTRQDVQQLLNNLKESRPAVVDELVPGLLPIGEVQRILASLLEEKVSIRDLEGILETLADTAPRTKHPDDLLEACRARLARQITTNWTETDGKLHVITLDPETEQRLQQVVTQTAMGGMLALDPQLASAFLERVRRAVETVAGQGHLPVILCGSGVRLPLFRLLSQSIPQITILSYSEILPSAQIAVLASVKL
jgi:flagellar biosynthesis protein FlhA